MTNETSASGSNLPKCHNCDRVIGRLEPKYTWEQFTVCAECFGRLSTLASPVAARAAVAVPPVQGAGAVPGVVGQGVVTPGMAEGHEEHKAEVIVFEGHPSLLVYAGSMLLAGVMVLAGLVGIVMFWSGGWVALAGRYFSYLLILGGGILALVRYLQMANVKYRLSSQRLFITTGILSKRTVETELFRVRDISVAQPILQRMLGIGTIHAVTTDKDIAEMAFLGIHEPMKVKELLRQHVMEARQRSRTRDLDVSDVDQDGHVM